MNKYLGIAGTGITLLAFPMLMYKYSVYYVDTGHCAIKFNKFSGVNERVFREGFHLMLPWFERPIIYDVRTHPTVIKSVTGSKDLQMININLRVLYRPDPTKLPALYRYLGTDYDARVLPSITNEVLKSVVAQYNAGQLLTQREQVSYLIRKTLEERAREFHILLDDVSITDLGFSKEFTKAIEEKQIAQQQAERAKYYVEQAFQDKKSTIIKAQGEARSAELFGQAMQKSPAFLELRRIDAAREIATLLANTRNKVYLDADTLLLNITQKFDQNLEKGSKSALEYQQEAASYASKK